MKSFGNRGDTIVEVLVVLAILGFAIAISYSSASRSLTDAEQSEQNSYASELAQSQIEEIRNAVNSSTPTSTSQISNLPSQAQGIGAVQAFCMSNGTAVLTSALPLSTCQPTDGGITYMLNDTLEQTLPPEPIQGLPVVNLFTVQVTWPDPLGQGTDEVTLFYRAYPPEAPS